MKNILKSAIVFCALAHAAAEASAVRIEGLFYAGDFTALLPITDHAAIVPQAEVTGSFRLSFDPETIENQYGNEFQILALINLDYLSLEINGQLYAAQDGHAWLSWNTISNQLNNVTVAGIENSGGGPNLLTSRATNDFIFVSSNNEFIYTTSDTTENWGASNVTSSLNVTLVPIPSSLFLFSTALPWIVFAAKRKRFI